MIFQFSFQIKSDREKTAQIKIIKNIYRRERKRESKYTFALLFEFDRIHFSLYKSFLKEFEKLSVIYVEYLR